MGQSAAADFVCTSYVLQQCPCGPHHDDLNFLCLNKLLRVLLTRVATSVEHSSFWMGHTAAVLFGLMIWPGTSATTTKSRLLRRENIKLIYLHVMLLPTKLSKPRLKR